MKALVYTANNEVTYRDEPAPEVAPGDALVRIETVGICGSDMHAYHGHDPRRVPPLILGHEACGRVVQGRYAGQRVVLNPLITCGECQHCLTGRANLCQARTAIGLARPGAHGRAGDHSGSQSDTDSGGHEPGARGSGGACSHGAPCPGAGREGHHPPPE